MDKVKKFLQKVIGYLLEPIMLLVLEIIFLLVPDDYFSDGD